MSDSVDAEQLAAVHDRDEPRTTVHLVKDGVVINTVIARSAEHAAELFPDHTIVPADGAQVGWLWDGATLTEPPRPTRIGWLDFKNRFTFAEMAALFEAMANTDLAMFVAGFSALGFVDLTAARTATFLAVLVSASVITSDRSAVIGAP